VFALAAGVLFRAPCPPYSSVSSSHANSL